MQINPVHNAVSLNSKDSDHCKELQQGWGLGKYAFFVTQTAWVNNKKEVYLKTYNCFYLKSHSMALNTILVKHRMFQ